MASCVSPVREVFIGITVALLFAYTWPEGEETSSEGTLDRSQEKSDPNQVGARA